MKSILPINLAFDRVVGNLAQLPFDEGIEIAVCGRSNSGKSSIINALGNNKKLAKTSKTPGRTQTVNFFTINDDPQTKLVDLPGYGYAKASKKDQNNWAQLVESYLLGRQCLRKVVVIMDIRHPFKEADLIFLNWCKGLPVNVFICLNKADKLSNNQAGQSLALAQRAAHQYPEIEHLQICSAEKGNGLEALGSFITF